VASPLVRWPCLARCVASLCLGIWQAAAAAETLAAGAQPSETELAEMFGDVEEDESSCAAAPAAPVVPRLSKLRMALKAKGLVTSPKRGANPAKPEVEQPPASSAKAKKLPAGAGPALPPAEKVAMFSPSGPGPIWDATLESNSMGWQP
jgi:hypothetical protein